MRNLTWEELERYISTLTNIQKQSPVTIVDNNHETILKVSNVDICDQNYYAHYEGLYYDEDIRGYDDDKMQEFLDDVYNIVYKESPILIID